RTCGDSSTTHVSMRAVLAVAELFPRLLYRLLATCWLVAWPVAFAQSPDHAGEAELRRLQAASDDGTVRSGGLANAIAERVRMVASRARAASQQKVAGISSSHWTELGPGNIGGR